MTFGHVPMCRFRGTSDVNKQQLAQCARAVVDYRCDQRQSAAASQLYAVSMQQEILQANTFKKYSKHQPAGLDKLILTEQLAMDAYLQSLITCVQSKPTKLQKPLASPQGNYTHQRP